jgi:glycosyltransferase involved in cell wall biosynthesis
MNNLLHISGNKYDGLRKQDHSYRIWKELACGVDNYYLLARSTTNKFVKIKEENITLLLLPKIINSSQIFVITSLAALYFVVRYRISKILAQDALAGGLSGILASKIFQIPILIEIHGDIYFDYFKENSIKKFILSKISKFILCNATKVRSLSSSMTDLLSPYIALDKIVLIPNRVDCDLFAPPKSSFILGNTISVTSVGRFVGQKGFDVAIQTIKQLSSTYNIKLTLVGGGILKDELLELIGDDDNIVLVDWIVQHKLIKFLKESDIYIQPSIPFLGEAMPRTILESMAMGLPIIATSVCAIPGILNSQNSILINSNSIPDLAAAIIKLIENEDLRKSIGERAYLDASEKYNWLSMFELYREQINALTYS